MEFKSDSEEYTSVPINKLYFSERVADMVEANGKTFPDNLLNNIVEDGTFKLNQKRLDSILAGYDRGLPPIKVSNTSGSKLFVVNGRHRVCASIMKGAKTIPVIFVNTSDN